jgi:uncharacterized protein (DUF4415 family)
MAEKLNVGGGKWQDPNDAPELTDEFFEQATIHDGARVIRRGRLKAAHTKTQVTLRLDADVLTALKALKATGPGWQTRANTGLKHWIAAQRHLGFIQVFLSQ